jgi:histidine decarboxylase
MTIQEKEQLDLYMNLMEKGATAIGYPIATDFNYSELFPLLRYHINNAGDPFTGSTYPVTSHGMEREVVEFFIDLFRASRQNSWGYVTNGGSEGNLYGLYVARERCPQAVVYYSASAHYSVPKSVHLLNMPFVVIRTRSNGEMDYDDLESAIRLRSDQPAIVIANIGTTMTEAKDDVGTIRRVLWKAEIQMAYIHCDAALAGPYLSVLDKDPKFDFVHGADSIACSGHKFIGSPFPCGVVIIKKTNKERIGQPVSYIGSLDTTITGSRNGHGPIFLWYAIKKQGRGGLLIRALECLSMAAYAQHKLVEGGINAWRNEKALTVVFPKPSESLCRKWQLACDEAQAHMVCMPGISKEMIDTLIDDLLCEQKINVPRKFTHTIYD